MAGINRSKAGKDNKPNGKPLGYEDSEVNIQGKSNPFGSDSLPAEKPKKEKD